MRHGQEEDPGLPVEPGQAHAAGHTQVPAVRRVQRHPRPQLQEQGLWGRVPDGARGGGRGPKKAGAEVVRLVTDGGGGGRGGGGAGAGRRCSRSGSGEGPEQRGRGAGADGHGHRHGGRAVLTRVSLGRCFLSACRQGRGGGRPRRSPAPAAAREPLRAREAGHGLPRPGHAPPAEELGAGRPPGLRPGAGGPVAAGRRVAGPLVQRVSRGTLVVKCHVTESHPLGLLHLSVGAGRGPEPGGAGALPLRLPGGRAGSAGAGAGAGARGGRVSGRGQGPGRSRPLPLAPEACLHFFACVCAFASDDKLAAEFSAFLNYDTNGVQVSLDCSMLCSSPQQQSDPGGHHRSKKLRMEDPGLVTAPTLAVREGSSAPALRKGGQRKHPISTAPKNSADVQPVHESHVSLPFRQWLSNTPYQTMHFHLDVKGGNCRVMVMMMMMVVVVVVVVMMVVVAVKMIMLVVVVMMVMIMVVVVMVMMMVVVVVVMMLVVVAVMMVMMVVVVVMMVMIMVVMVMMMVMMMVVVAVMMMMMMMMMMVVVVVVMMVMMVVAVIMVVAVMMVVVVMVMMMMMVVVAVMMMMMMTMTCFVQESLSRWCSTSLSLSSTLYSSACPSDPRRGGCPTPPQRLCGNDALPLGTFSKYTWHITNLLQVKRIFDTQELPLELTQSFVKNRDGSFSPFRCQEAPPSLWPRVRAGGPAPGHPAPGAAHLPQSPSSSEQKEATPFVIEWIPDILPRSRVGELRIRRVRAPARAPARRPARGLRGAPSPRAPTPPPPPPRPSLEIIRVAVP
ncbi:hypothetical protein ANANG_G00257830 [Anguilla anguilla]|uniref:Uncharacterized protein n=1 Tax=Anguilla anguilla TaxID=7936 RepID=A0A9D3LPQ5_ANGAN|nr:hypothetical protein ANANG_G00257830 [Anguilla anguilla]